MKIKIVIVAIIASIFCSCSNEEELSLMAQEKTYQVPDELGNKAIDTVAYQTKVFTQNNVKIINTGVNLNAAVGEAFLGVAQVVNWLVQAPQDHHSIVFYNTKTGKVRELNVSKYQRAIPKNGANHRDKFNGIVSSHGGRFLWVCPSWTTHLLKIDVEKFTIAKEYKVNPNKDDAYNEMVVTDKYLWLVTHSKEDLPRIDLETEEITFFNLKEVANGDFNFGNNADNRSFYGGVNNGDGTIFLFPRRSKFLIKIEEETGKIIGKYAHPFSHKSSPAYGYFYGAIKVGDKIYFSPWSQKKIVVFDVVKETFYSVDINISGNVQFSLGTVYDGQHIWMAPFKAKELLKINATSEEVSVIDVAAYIDTYQYLKTRKNQKDEVAFGGNGIYHKGAIWFSAIYESCFVKIAVDKDESLRF